MEYKRTFYDRYIKRIIDSILSLIAIIILSPVIIITSILVAIKLGRPVIFKQQRPGLDEKIFTMYKFRSMTDERGENGELLPDEVRLTRFGKKLRATSLDELPELFNILKGDMAIVGPRPQLVKDMVFMTKQQRLRHKVRPGLTGWAQINGRNSVLWEQKLLCDIYYIKNESFFLDIKIIFKTIKCVLRKDGISFSNMDTAEDLGDYLLRVKQVSINEYNEKMQTAKIILEELSNRIR